MKFDKFIDMTVGIRLPPVIQTSVIFFHFSAYIFLADVTPDTLNFSRVTNVKVLFLVLVYVFNFS